MSDDENFQEIQHLKTIAKGASLIFLGFIISKLISYLYRIFIARYFGSEYYGLFSLGLAIITIVSIIPLLGLQTGITKFVSECRSKNDKRRIVSITRSSLFMVAIASVIASALLIILSPWLSDKIFHNTGLAPFLVILSLSIPFTCLMYVFISVFLGFQQTKYKVYSESLYQNFFKLIAIAILTFLGFESIGIPLSFTIGAVAAFIISLYYLEAKTFSFIRNKGKQIPVKIELLKYSLPLLVVSFLTVLLTWVDSIILGYFWNVETVGIYNAAAPTAQLLLMVPMSFGYILFPVITDLYSRNLHEEMKRVYKTVTKWIFYINFPLFLFMLFFSGKVLNILFGSEYVAGSTALIIISIGYILASLLYYPGLFIMNMLNKNNTVMLVTIIASVGNVLLNLLLIPTYGMIGAAIASLAAMLFISLTIPVLSHKHIKTHPLSVSIVKSVFASIISISLIYFVYKNILIELSVISISVLFVLFLSSYFIMLVVFRGIEKEDIEMLRMIAKRFGIRIEFIIKFLKKFV